MPSAEFSVLTWSLFNQFDYDNYRHAVISSNTCSWRVHRVIVIVSSCYPVSVRFLYIASNVANFLRTKRDELSSLSRIVFYYSIIRFRRNVNLNPSHPLLTFHPLISLLNPHFRSRILLPRRISPPYPEVPLCGFCEILALTCLDLKACPRRRWWSGRSRGLARSPQAGEEASRSTGTEIHCKPRTRNVGPARKIAAVRIEAMHGVWLSLWGYSMGQEITKVAKNQKVSEFLPETWISYIFWVLDSECKIKIKKLELWYPI